MTIIREGQAARQAKLDHRCYTYRWDSSVGALRSCDDCGKLYRSSRFKEWNRVVIRKPYYTWRYKGKVKGPSVIKRIISVIGVKESKTEEEI